MDDDNKVFEIKLNKKELKMLEYGLNSLYKSLLELKSEYLKENVFHEIQDLKNKLDQEPIEIPF